MEPLEGRRAADATQLGAAEAILTFDNVESATCEGRGSPNVGRRLQVPSPPARRRGRKSMLLVRGSNALVAAGAAGRGTLGPFFSLTSPRDTVFRPPRPSTTLHPLR